MHGPEITYVGHQDKPSDIYGSIGQLDIGPCSVYMIIQETGLLHAPPNNFWFITHTHLYYMYVPD